MDKAVKISIMTGALMVGLSIAFYFVYYLPSREQRLGASRQDCANIAIQKAKSEFQKRAEILKRKYLTAEYDQEEYDSYFDMCLREKGVSN